MYLRRWLSPPALLLRNGMIVSSDLFSLALNFSGVKRRNIKTCKGLAGVARFELATLGFGIRWQYPYAFTPVCRQGQASTNLFVIWQRAEESNPCVGSRRTSGFEPDCITICRARCNCDTALSQHRYLSKNFGSQGEGRTLMPEGAGF